MNELLSSKIRRFQGQGKGPNKWVKALALVLALYLVSLLPFHAATPCAPEQQIAQEEESITPLENLLSSFLSFFSEAADKLPKYPKPLLESTALTLPTLSQEEELFTSQPFDENFLKSHLRGQEALDYSFETFAANTLPLTLYKPEVRPLERYGLPVGEVVSLGEGFTPEVRWMKEEEKEDSYLFSLSLKPTASVTSHDLKQSFLFVVDLTNSAAKRNIEIYNKALSRALAALPEGTLFNIAYFEFRRSKVLAKEPLIASKENIAKVSKFFQGSLKGEAAASDDLLLFFDALVDQKKSTALCFITNGKVVDNSFTDPSRWRNWLQSHKDSLSLYTFAAGQKNYLPILHLVAESARGQLFYSDTLAGFARFFASATQKISTPIAHDLSFTALLSDPETTIEFFTHYPLLYNNQPYLLLGRLSSPKEFTFLLQGEHGSQTLHYKTLVTFSKEENNSSTLKKHMLHKKASDLFSKYLQEGQARTLSEATQLLSPIVNESRSIR